MRRIRRQSGFVLLMVLVLVLMAGTVLAGVAWRSAVGAIESQDAVEELQRRWAVTSCQATLLARAEELLDEAERGMDENGKTSEKYLNKPQPELRMACRLAEIDYELILTDEQAKLNVDSLCDATSRENAQSVVERLIDDSGDPVAVSLRTLAVVDDSATGRALRKVGAYGQVFRNASPERLVGDRRESGLASTITCWGDGKVNLRRAKPAVIAQVCEKTLGSEGVAALVAARDRDPYRSASVIIGELTRLDGKKRANALKLLTDKSACHGLWVIARGSQRSWYTFTVDAQASGSTTDQGGSEAEGSAAEQTTQPTEGGQPTSGPSVVNRHEFQW